MQAHFKNILLHLSILINLSTCRDFYLGMFRKDDLLMSHDTLYKERVPFRFIYAKYGRTYNCLITYVRVIDRLNIGRGPRVEIIRGGLRKRYIVLRLTSPYNNPISVNIFVGCENKKFTRPPWKIIRPTTKTTTKSAVKSTEQPKEESTIKEVATEKGAGDAEINETTVLEGKEEETTPSNVIETTLAGEEHTKGGNEGGEGGKGGEGGEGGKGGEGGEGGKSGEGGEGGEGGKGAEGERKK